LYSQIWKQWRINSATDLNGFKDRAVQLEALRKEGDRTLE
jgi:hypothetical protein